MTKFFRIYADKHKFHNRDSRIIPGRILASGATYIVDEQPTWVCGGGGGGFGIFLSVYIDMRSTNTMGMPRRLLAVNTDDGEIVRR